MSLKILFLSVEVAPFAKVGGLADVAGSLPKALRAAGHDTRLFVPAYGMGLASEELAAERVAELTVPMNPNWTAHPRLYSGVNEGVPTWLVGDPEHFEWVQRSEDLYSFGRESYLMYAKSAFAACEKMDWIPDIIHCNDWQTGFAPVYLKESAGERWANTKSVYTIHNLAYQGQFGQDTLGAAGLSQSLFTGDKLEFFGQVNFVKCAAKYADQVNTVSPNYANEIQTERYGCGLWGLMRDLHEKGQLRGILNGIDLDHFDPEKDPHIAANYTADQLAGKSICKAAIQKELGLPVDPEIPIMAMVSRLSDQKGFDMLIRSAYGYLGLPVQFVVLAVGDPWAAGELRKLEGEWPDNVRFIERFDAPLAQRIYAGSDFFMMPSHFEPCGLGQMIAFRYGSVPVARRTGGLADTVFDGENGFVFEEANARELYEAIKRTVETYPNKPVWNKLVQAGMKGDYSWTSRAEEYVEMYRDALGLSVKVAR